MKMWAARLDALRGFYDSSVYGLAETKEEAVQKMMDALELYFDKQVEDFGVSFMVDGESEPDEPGFEENRLAWIEKTRSELIDKIYQTSDVVISAKS